MKIILASSSPRRKKLLRVLIDEFEIIPSEREEKIENLAPWVLVKKLAFQKAQEVFDRVSKDSNDILVIGADTLVAIKDKGKWKVIGKARNKQRAKKMLKFLSGKQHFVYTGVCFLSNKIKKVFIEKSKVVFRKITDQEIEEYLDKAIWQDKAGAYAIQEKGGAFVKKYSGSLTNIWGFPLEKITYQLKKMKIRVKYVPDIDKIFYTRSTKYFKV